MSDISSLIDVFRMVEVSEKSRAEIIIRLGQTINDSYGANLTEPIVYELVKILEPANPILNDEHYNRYEAKS